MISFSFIYPGVPVGKGRPRITNRPFPHSYTPAKTRAEEDAIRLVATPKAPKVPLKEPLSISIEFYYPIPKSWSKKKQLEAAQSPCSVKPDLDNAAKLVLDALNGLFYEDDKQITNLYLSKRYSTDPRSVVTIHTL